MSVASCPRCGNAKHRGRCKGGGNVKRKPEPVAEPTPPPAPAPAQRIDIAPGLGVSAWIENGCLQLAQGEDARDAFDFREMHAKYKTRATDSAPAAPWTSGLLGYPCPTCGITLTADHDCTAETVDGVKP